MIPGVFLIMHMLDSEKMVEFNTMILKDNSNWMVTKTTILRHIEAMRLGTNASEAGTNDKVCKVSVSEDKNGSKPGTRCNCCRKNGHTSDTCREVDYCKNHSMYGHDTKDCHMTKNKSKDKHGGGSRERTRDRSRSMT